MPPHLASMFVLIVAITANGRCSVGSRRGGSPDGASSHVCPTDCVYAAWAQRSRTLKPSSSLDSKRAQKSTDLDLAEDVSQSASRWGFVPTRPHAQPQRQMQTRLRKSKLQAFLCSKYVAERERKSRTEGPRAARYWKYKPPTRKGQRSEFDAPNSAGSSQGLSGGLLIFCLAQE